MVGHKISEFLHQKGYSNQNLAVIKRMDRSILIGEESLPLKERRWEYMNYRFCPGDVLTVHINEEECSQKIVPVEIPLNIVYEDEDLLVVNKPSGMPIHPSMKHYENTLGNAAAFYFAGQKKPFIYRCVNRLDRDTTGLTILAKHLVSASILYDEMVARRVKRTYTAIVEGEDLPDSGTIDLPLGRKPDSAVERMVDPVHGERAVTHYRVLARGAGLSMVECLLDTGRTHQIRVHMAYIGHPLIGDFLYNEENHQMARQALHAGALSFRQPMTGEMLNFSVPLPKDMYDVSKNVIK
ncbi:MAG: RluA family pseudouridine synthase [Lachnospiraceae bacterium]|nr:RluA family pseudouridine synthase [Lachnospiraceae bacterium]